jgi:hypothetical protein
MKITAKGHIKNGRLVINKSELPVFLHKISKQKNKSVEVIVQFGNQRSLQQNNYYFGVIVELIRLAINESNGENFTKEDIHEFLKNRFIEGKEIVNKHGEVISIRKSTTDNTTTLQEEYHEQCRQFAAEYLNIEIPFPNEKLTLNL